MSNSGTESWDKTEDITEEKFDHVFNLNARAQFFVGQAAWRHLEDNGRLILMSSIAAGLLGVKDHCLYNASKMAVIGMIKAFATDFGVRGITVNGVAPGGIKSDMFTQNAWHYIPGGTPDWPADKIEKLMAEHCPLKRCAVPEDVARVVAFLASDDGGWVNGKSLTFDSVQTMIMIANSASRPSYHHLWWVIPVNGKSKVLISMLVEQGHSSSVGLSLRESIAAILEHCMFGMDRTEETYAMKQLQRQSIRFYNAQCRSVWS